MPQYVIVRLYPEKPVRGQPDFSGHLNGIRVRISDRSFALPQGGAVLGQALHDPNPANTTIVQHSWHQITPPRTHWEAVATAVIELPVGLPEFTSADIRIVLERNGNWLAEHRWNYNLPILTQNVAPAKADYPTLSPVSAYMALPPPGQELDPLQPQVELPEDGSAPKFADLHAAISAVVAQDPGGIVDLTQLTEAQCFHIASEITWNRAMHPTPQPPIDLAKMYTTDYQPPPNVTPRNQQEAEEAIRKFEENNRTYQLERKSDATMLAKYVFAYSAALRCEQLTKTASSAAIQVPIHTTGNAPVGKTAFANIKVTS